MRRPRTAGSASAQSFPANAGEGHRAKRGGGGEPTMRAPPQNSYARRLRRSALPTSAVRPGYGFDCASRLAPALPDLSHSSAPDRPLRARFLLREGAAGDRDRRVMTSAIGLAGNRRSDVGSTARGVTVMRIAAGDVMRALDETADGVANGYGADRAVPHHRLGRSPVAGRIAPLPRECGGGPEGGGGAPIDYPRTRRNSGRARARRSATALRDRRARPARRPRGWWR